MAQKTERIEESNSLGRWRPPALALPLPPCPLGLVSLPTSSAEDKRSWRNRLWKAMGEEGEEITYHTTHSFCSKYYTHPSSVPYMIRKMQCITDQLTEHLMWLLIIFLRRWLFLFSFNLSLYQGLPSFPCRLFYLFYAAFMLCNTVLCCFGWLVVLLLLN